MAQWKKWTQYWKALILTSLSYTRRLDIRCKTGIFILTLGICRLAFFDEEGEVGCFMPLPISAIAKDTCWSEWVLPGDSSLWLTQASLLWLTGTGPLPCSASSAISWIDLTLLLLCLTGGDLLGLAEGWLVTLTGCLEFAPWPIRCWTCCTKRSIKEAD